MSRLGGECLRLRMVKLAARVMQGRPVTTAYIRRIFGVSKATAKRDLESLQTYLPVTTHRKKLPNNCYQRELRVSLNDIDQWRREVEATRFAA